MCSNFTYHVYGYSQTTQNFDLLFLFYSHIVNIAHYIASYSCKLHCIGDVHNTHSDYYNGEQDFFRIYMKYCYLCEHLQFATIIMIPKIISFNYSCIMVAVKCSIIPE